MKIYEILPRLDEVEIFGIADIEITDITEHSAHVSCGTALLVSRACGMTEIFILPRRAFAERECL